MNTAIHQCVRVNTRDDLISMGIFQNDVFTCSNIVAVGRRIYEKCIDSYRIENKIDWPFMAGPFPFDRLQIVVRGFFGKYRHP